MPKLPLHRKSDDESWSLQAKLLPVDLNPHFGSSSSESLMTDDDLDVMSTVGNKKKRKRGAHEIFIKTLSMQWTKLIIRTRRQWISCNMNFWM